jgi:hypothetical protein
LTLDISTPDGQAIVRRLAARADVVLENYKVGTLDRYGLGYSQLRDIHPGLIYCAITGFGQTGPYAHRAGYDFMIQGLGGLMSVTGRPDEEPGGGPQKVGVALIDSGGIACPYRNRRRSIHRLVVAGCAGGMSGESGAQLFDERTFTGALGKWSSEYRAVPGF